MAQESSGLYKIGLSKDPQARLRGLQKAAPAELALLHTIHTENMFQTEQDLHQRFVAKRKHGEWFALDEADVEIILNS